MAQVDDIAIGAGEPARSKIERLFNGGAEVIVHACEFFSGIQKVPGKPRKVNPKATQRLRKHHEQTQNYRHPKVA